jgi:hypothetical protein
MKVLLILPLFLTLTSCDAPVRGRAVRTINGSGLEATSGNFSTPDSGSTGGTTGQTGSNPPGTPGFDSCNLSQQYHASALGHIGLCQNSQTETLFRFKPSMSDSSSRTCLIPTYKDVNGSSTYIGQPQCSFTESNVVLQGYLYKNREGFTDRPLNSVMIMKEGILQGYFNCMHGFVNWLQIACPNGPSTSSYCYNMIAMCPNGANTNGNCNVEAQRFRTDTCNRFKTTHAQEYLDIRTR